MNVYEFRPRASLRRSKTPTEIVTGFEGLRAVVVGDAMLDTYVDGAVTRICKEGPVPVVDWTGERSLPGGAANVAVNLAALGAVVRFAGLAGADSAGSTLRAALQAGGVSTAGLIADSSCATLHKLRIAASGQYLVRLDSGSTCADDGRVRERLRQTLEESIAECDLLVVSDYGYGTIDDRLIGQLADYRNRRRSVLAIDAKHPLRYAGLRAHVMTPNLAEACQAIGAQTGALPSTSLEHAAAVAAELRGLVDVDSLIVTLAGDGALLLDRQGTTTHIPSRPVGAAQDIGAGDTFVAAVALALAAQAFPRQAAEIGVEAALLAITQERTSVVDRQELVRRVNLTERAADTGVGSIAPLIDTAWRHGKSIVFTNGVFDILHVGHIDLLRRAKALGDVLVVGINSDASTRRLKGPSRPINSERDRLALVSALESVDIAVIFEEDTPERLICALRPDIHVKGGDYRPEDLPEAAAVAAVGGRIEILPFVEGRSTTRLIESIRYRQRTDVAGVGG